MRSAFLILGGCLLMAAATVAWFAYLGRDLPTRCDDILTLPQPGPDMQDAIDGGDDFATHVDEALAIANDQQPPTATHDHGRTHPSLHHADWAAWETELTAPTRRDQP